MRLLDVVLVVIVTAPALLLGVPALGYLVGAGAWLLQRLLAQLDKSWVRNKGAAPRAQLGFNLFEAFGRIWLLAGGIVIAGVAGSRADGLTAAVVIFCAYSIAFAVRVLSGPPQRQSTSALPPQATVSSPEGTKAAASPGGSLSGRWPREHDGGLTVRKAAS